MAVRGEAGRVEAGIMSMKAYRYSDEVVWRGAVRRLSAGRGDAGVGGSKRELYQGGYVWL